MGAAVLSEYCRSSRPQALVVPRLFFLNFFVVLEKGRWKHSLS